MRSDRLLWRRNLPPRPSFGACPGVLEVDADTRFWVAGPKALRLSCHAGVLWLTLGDGCDHLLAPGDDLRIDLGQRALVSVIDGARLSIVEVDVRRAWGWQAVANMLTAPATRERLTGN